MKKLWFFYVKHLSLSIQAMFEAWTGSDGIMHNTVGW
jgi:hypothetical protein